MCLGNVTGFLATVLKILITDEKHQKSSKSLTEKFVL